MNNPETITCPICHEAKPLTDFPTSCRAKSGHVSICRTCYGLRISTGKSRNSPPPELQISNPKFEGQTPRQLIAALKELITELKARGYSYKGELTYLQRIKL